MAGLLDWIGERLDTPLQGVGINPAGMSDAEKWGMRGRVVSAFGNSIGTGAPNFYGQLDNMAGAYAEQQEKLKQQQLQEQMQQQMAQVARTGGSSAGVYRQYAAMFASQGKPDLAKKYMDIADALEPKEEFGQPVAVTGADGNPTLAQFSKTGAMRPVAGVAPAADLTGDIKNYQFAVKQGYTGSFNQFVIDQKKAGASNITFDPNKSFGSTLGTGVGEHVNNTFLGAQAANDTLTSVKSIRDSLGNAIVGPLADERAMLLRMQSTLGIAPAEAAQRLADTRRVLQGLARQELAAASQMKGQGAITENERAILKNAESGTTSLTPAEIKVVVDTMEATARKRIAAHQGNVERLRRVPGAETVLPFYEMQNAPPAGNPGAGGPPDLQDAARREIERRQRGGR